MSLYRLIGEHLAEHPEHYPLRAVVVISLTECGRVSAMFYSDRGEQDNARITTAIMRDVGGAVAHRLDGALDLGLDAPIEPSTNEVSAELVAQREYQSFIKRLTDK
jgi:hypothetical protein